MCAGPAAAITIPAVDLDTWMTGGSIAPAITDLFDTAAPPPPTVGTIFNEVFFDGTQYTYTHTVTPSLSNNFLFNTEFAVKGFTGVAGWSFSSVGGGGAGDPTAFAIDQIGGRLLWRPVFSQGEGWDAGDSIRFFFVSTQGPGLGDYNLSTSDVGTATSYAPIPEPGSIALLGSGLVGLYAAIRRRRQLQS
jgi:hypothetical protein